MNEFPLCATFGEVCNYKQWAASVLDKNYLGVLSLNGPRVVREAQALPV
jgi:hypothetical protein